MTTLTIESLRALQLKRIKAAIKRYGKINYMQARKAMTCNQVNARDMGSLNDTICVFANKGLLTCSWDEEGNTLLS